MLETQGVLFHEIIAQDRQVFGPFPQWRNLYRDDIYAVIEVFPEPARLNRLFEVLVCCRDDPHIDIYGLAAPYPLKRPFLKNP